MNHHLRLLLYTIAFSSTAAAQVTIEFSPSADINLGNNNVLSFEVSITDGEVTLYDATSVGDSDDVDTLDELFSGSFPAGTNGNFTITMAPGNIDSGLQVRSNAGLGSDALGDGRRIAPGELVDVSVDFSESVGIGGISFLACESNAGRNSTSVIIRDFGAVEQNLGEAGSGNFDVGTGPLTHDLAAIDDDGATADFTLAASDGSGTMTFTALGDLGNYNDYGLWSLTFDIAFDESNVLSFTADQPGIYGSSDDITLAWSVPDHSENGAPDYQIVSNNPTAFNGGNPIDAGALTDSGGNGSVVVTFDGSLGEHNLTLVENSSADAVPVFLPVPIASITEFAFGDPDTPGASSGDIEAYLFTIGEGTGSDGTRSSSGLELFYDLDTAGAEMAVIEVSSSASSFAYNDAVAIAGPNTIPAEDAAVSTVYTLTVDNGNGPVSQEVEVFVDQEFVIDVFSVNGFQVGGMGSLGIELDAIGDFDFANSEQGAVLDFSADGVNFLPVFGAGDLFGSITELSRSDTTLFVDKFTDSLDENRVGPVFVQDVLADLAVTPPVTITARLRITNQIGTSERLVSFDVVESDTLGAGFFDAESRVDGQPWQNNNIKPTGEIAPFLEIVSGGFIDVSSDEVSFTRGFSGVAGIGNLLGNDVTEGDATFALWAELPEPSEDAHIILDLGSNGEGVSLVYQSGSIILTLTNDAETVTSVSQAVAPGWRHLAVTIDLLSDPAAPVLRLFIDGSLAETLFGVVTGDRWASGNPSALGGQMGSAAGFGFGLPFPGAINKFVIETTLLEASGIESLYDAFITAVPDSSVRVTAFTFDPTTGNAEISISGVPSTNYKIVEAGSLDFGNPEQDPVPLAGVTVGTLDGSEVTTDEAGNATVQLSLGVPGSERLRTFIRAETP